MRAIGYPRVSTAGQEKFGWSLNEQVAKIERFCEIEGIELVAHFKEVESASTVKDRVAFKAALRRVHEADVDAIIVVNLDRFSRRVLDAELIRDTLKRKKKQLISIEEIYLTPLVEAPSADHNDYLESALQHRMVDAEMERKRIRRRLVNGRNRKVESGGWQGHRPPYEYDVIQGELVLNQSRAAIIRLISRLFKLRNEDGTPMFTGGMVAQYLNGYNDLIDPKTGKRGRKFDPPSARLTLRKSNARKQFPSDQWNVSTIYRIKREIALGLRHWPNGRTPLPKTRENRQGTDFKKKAS